MIMEEEDGEGTPKTPFWVQSSGGRRREISSIFLNSGILIIFLCLAAVFSILFIIPWFLNLTSQILKPNLVKKSWDWINAVLIILALIFGFLSRNKNNDEEKSQSQSQSHSSSSSSSTLFQWDEFSNRGTSNSNSSSFGLKRNSSSYPDLRDMKTFLDDHTHVENHRLSVDLDPELRNVEQKIDPVRKQVMGTSENMEKRNFVNVAPPYTAAMTAAELPEKKKVGKSERKRSGGTGTKEFVNSFYHQSKKKKNQRAKSLDNFESLLSHSNLNVPPPPPQSPPPPPPRTSVFKNIISTTKKRKPKKTISVPAPPPPPPPPPMIKTERKPVKVVALNRGRKTHEDESPFHPIPPPPPPPPPFKMPSWKFVVQGDYVRVGSFNSSSISESSDADAEERESPTTGEISNVDSSGTHTAAAPPPLFCPSPDVNTKADMFIARFRAGLQLQKINSLEQKQRLGMSNLGPQAQTNDHSPRPK